MNLERAREAIATTEDVFTYPEGDAVVISSIKKVRGEGYVATVSGANFTGTKNLNELRAREEELDAPA